MPAITPPPDAPAVSPLIAAYVAAGGDPRDLILMGGSAAIYWHHVFAESAGAPMQTGDIDFQLAATDQAEAVVDRLARACGGGIARPGIDHETPEIAVVTVPTPDGTLVVDILPDVPGVDHRAIVEHSGLLQIGSEAGDVQEIAIIHPTHVLIGLEHNYHHFPGIRRDVSRRRAGTFVPTCRRYIADMAARGAGESRPNAMEADARWAMQTLLKHCDTVKNAAFTADTGVDFLEAVPAAQEAPVEERFWRNEYPRLVGRVERRRQAHANRRANTSPDGPGI